MELKELRESKGLTQIEAAKRLGVGLSSYRLWEYGVTKPNLTNQKKLNEFFRKEK